MENMKLMYVTSETLKKSLKGKKTKSKSKSLENQLRNIAVGVYPRDARSEDIESGVQEAFNKLGEYKDDGNSLFGYIKSVMENHIK